MKLTFAAFSKLGPCPVIIHSVDQALYRATVIDNGRERLLVERSGRPFVCRCLHEMREALSTMPVARLTLRQQSAYDEMIGQPQRQQSNALEVPLSLELYPPITKH